MTDDSAGRDHTIRAACKAFEDAWRSGDRPSLTAFTERFAGLDRAVLLRELLPRELDFRRLAGESPTAEEYRARFPELGDLIADLFAVSQTLTIASGTMTSNRRPAPTPMGSFGDYDLLEELGRGGMGVVYRARQRSLNRIVAIKTTRSGDQADGGELARFKAEAEAVARLEHPNIVPIHEVGEHRGQFYFSMGYVNGPSLSELLQDGPLAPRRAAELGWTIAGAVAYAHDVGVVHRDLKPGNVLLDAKGRPWVTDFGLAKQLESDSRMTVTSEILGTPSFMPPEQAQGQPVGPAVDVYSLGALLYCLVTGRPPFQAATSVETLRQVVEVDPVPPRRLNPAVGRDLETILLRCLEKEPSKRYASMRMLGDELARVLAGEPILARPVGAPERLARWCRRRPALAATSVVALLAVVVCVVTLVVAVVRIRSARDSALEIARRNGHLLEVFQQERESFTDASRAEIRTLRQRHVATLCQLAIASQPTHNRDRTQPDHATLRRLHDVMTTAATRHSETVTAALSRDADRLATGESTGIVRLWSLRTGTEMDQRSFGDRAVDRMAFAADDSTLVVVTDDGAEHEWVPNRDAAVPPGIRSP